MASRNNIPSVTYMSFVVLGPFTSVVLSNLTRCPTTVPDTHPTSSATRLATVMAATRRGCVMQMVRARLRFNNPHSCRDSVTVTSLQSETRYYYGTRGTDGTILRQGTFHTTPPKGQRSNFKFATAGCAFTGSEAEVFRKIRDEEPLFFLQLGDTGVFITKI